MIREIAGKLGFPDEATEYLTVCEERMDACASSEIRNAMESLFTPGDNEYLDILEKISRASGVDRRSSDMVFLLKSAVPLLDKYRAAGYSDRLYYDTVTDLRVKLFECKNVYGVWGTFVTDWFKGFYLLNRFRLGRMQYERSSLPFDDYRGIVKRGDPILYCHIPSGEPLREADVIESLRQAYGFYEKDRVNGHLSVMCFSWLLYTPIFKDYKEGTNIKRFYNMFDILRDYDNERNKDFWRVFNVEYSPNVLDTVVADNSLKRAVIDHLKNGGVMGDGAGILIIDEKMRNL